LPTEPLVEEIAKVSFRGTVNLLLAQALSAVISILTSIILARLLGADNFGEIAIVMILPNIIILFQDFGLGQAITRWIAINHSKREYYEVKKYIRAGLLFEAFSGILLTIIAIGVSQAFVTRIIGRSDLLYLVILASLIVIGQSMIATGKSILIGLDRTIKYAALIVLNIILQGFLPITLVLLGQGLQGAIIGLVATSLSTGLISLILILHIENGIMDTQKVRDKKLLSYLREMLSFSFPLFLSIIAGGLLPQILYTIAAQNLSSASIGNYTVAIGLSGVMLFISSPIITALFPALSKFDGVKDKQELGEFFSMGIKFTSILVVPTAALLSTLAYPLVTLLYGFEFQEAQFYFILALIPSFNVVIGSLVIGGLLKAQDHTTQYFLIHLIQLVVGASTAYLTTPQYGVLGLFIATISSSFIALVIGGFWIRINYQFSPDLKFTMKILGVSFISIILSLIGKTLIAQAHPLIIILISTGLFAFTFLSLFAIFGVLNNSELHALRNLLESIGRIVRPMIIIIQVIQNIRHKLHRSNISELNKNHEP